MNVLREVFYWIKEEGDHESAAHLRGHGSCWGASLVIRRWSHKQRAGTHHDRALVSLQRFLIDSGHFRIARNDVARPIIGGQFDQHTAVLGHGQPNHSFIFADVDLCLADKEIQSRSIRWLGRGLGGDDSLYGSM